MKYDTFFNIGYSNEESIGKSLMIIIKDKQTNETIEIQSLQLQNQAIFPKIYTIETTLYFNPIKNFDEEFTAWRMNKK